MKSFILVLMVLVVAGCSQKAVVTPNGGLDSDKSMSDYLIAEPNDWKSKFGDNEVAKLYYNVVLHKVVLDNQIKTLQGLLAAVKAQQATINILIQDVNSIKVK